MVFTAAKKVELPNFGEKLKKMREGLGLTKERAAQMLNTQIKHLDYLESGEYEKLPAAVYTNGLLRRYAKILEVDGQAFVEEYRKELNIARHLNKTGIHRTLPLLRSPRFVVTPKSLSWLAGFLFFLAVVGYLGYQISFLLKPPKLVLTRPSADMAQEARALEFAGQTDPGAQLTINGESVAIERDGSFKKTLDLNVGLNTITIVSVNQFGKKSEVIRNIVVR